MRKCQRRWTTHSPSTCPRSSARCWARRRTSSSTRRAAPLSGRVSPRPPPRREGRVLLDQGQVRTEAAISVYHLTVWRDPTDSNRAAVASKQIYASHYFRAGLDLVALVDAPSPRGGFYLIDLYRARIDPPTGTLAGVLLGKIHAGIERGVAERLRTAKERTEAP